MKNRGVQLVSLVLLILLVQSCRLVDIRTTEVKESYNPEKGIDILNEMSKTHGLEQWDSIKNYSLHIDDEFYGLMGKMGNPFPNNKAEFDFSLIPKTFTSQAIFTDKKWKDKIWGIQSWKTYSTIKSDSLKFDKKNNRTIEFWLPTYQYFIEIPNRIFEADRISFAGERMYNGKAHYLVFASWTTDSPQKNTDQYILWIDKETHVLRLIQYTVRDQFKWLNATLVYDTYKTFNGLLLPMNMSISLSAPSQKKVMHQINISNVKLNDNKNIIIDSKLGTKGKE